VKANLIATTTAEKRETQKLLDTRQNAILTVGTGTTYSTISAAMTAASSGDTIAAYSNATNTYTENVAVQKVLQIIGMAPGRGITITAASGIVVQFSGSLNSYGSFFENFRVLATGTATMAVDAWYAAYALTIRDIEAAGGTTAAFRGYANTRFINCLVRDAAVGFWTDQSAVFLNCVAVDNTTYGFQGGSSGNCVLCIGAGNGTADFYQAVIYSCLNTSADATAPGAGSVTGFLTSDFVDYAGNNFRLKASVKDTTKARFAGYPRYPRDGFGGERQTAGIVYAGWSDPDPVGACILSGTFAATKHSSQNQVVLNLTGLTQSGGLFWVMALRAGSTPVGSEETYLTQFRWPVATTAPTFMQNIDSSQVNDDALLYITIGVENSAGTRTWLGGTAVTITPHSYLVIK
jgi:hypothetical protein